jgi:hypothetical protein
MHSCEWKLHQALPTWKHGCVRRSHAQVPAPPEQLAPFDLTDDAALEALEAQAIEAACAASAAQQKVTQGVQQVLPLSEARNVLQSMPLCCGFRQYCHLGGTAQHYLQHNLLFCTTFCSDSEKEVTV